MYFGLFPIYFFARIAKRMGGVVGRLSFDVQGRGGFPNLDPFGQTEKEGRGCKNWPFFMDVINVWSLRGRRIHGSSDVTTKKNYL